MYRVITGGFSVRRRAALVLVEHVLIVLVGRAGRDRAARHCPTTPAAASMDWAVPGRRRRRGPADLPALRRPVRSAHAGSTAGTCSTGLLRALGAASVILAVVYFWLPYLVIGRGVFALATIAHHRARGRLADGVRVAVAARRTHRAAADRRHRRRRGDAWRASCSSAAANWASSWSVSSTADPAKVGYAGGEPGRHRHGQRHSRHRARTAGSIASS